MILYRQWIFNTTGEHSLPLVNMLTDFHTLLKIYNRIDLVMKGQGKKKSTQHTKIKNINDNTHSKFKVIFKILESVVC